MMKHSDSVPQHHHDTRDDTEPLTTYRKVLRILFLAKRQTDLGHCSDAYNAFDCQVGNVCLVLEIRSDPGG